MKHVDARLLAGTALTAPETKDSSPEKLLQEVRTTVEDFMKGFEEFKSTNEDRLKQIEAKGSADPVTEEKLRNIEASLEEGEKLSKKLTEMEQAQKAAADAAKQTEDLLAKLEAKVNRPGPGSAGEKAAKRKILIDNWARGVFQAETRGVANLEEPQRKAIEDIVAEHKALNVTTDTAGGYLAPSEMVMEILKGVTELTPARQIARVRSTAYRTLTIPKRTGRISARWVTEEEERTETPGLSYALNEMPLHEMYAVVDITQQMLEDSAFDIEGEIVGEANEQFSVLEGQAFISGTGVGQWEGLLTHGDIAETVSGKAGEITADGLLKLKHAIKTAYTRDATFLLNRTSLGAVRRFKTGDGQYIWMPGLAQGRPNTIDGDPYVEAPDMPDQAADAYPVLYGDFRRGYTIGDRIAMTMMRDPYTRAANGTIRFWFRKRCGGQVMLAEAMVKLKCATS